MPLVSTFGSLSARGFGFGAAAKAFTPLSLFASGEQGVWYDPSDLTTMFEDSAGTTPVHTPGNGTADSPVGKILDKSGRGNHATQSTSTARPTLSALYNLLTYSQDFTNAVWTKENLLAFGSGSVANTTDTTDPLGTYTASKIAISTSTGEHRFYQTATLVSTSKNLTRVVHAKAGTASFISISSGTNSAYAVFDLSTGAVSSQTGLTSATITSLGNNWYRCTIVGIPAVTTNYEVINIGTTAANAVPQQTFAGSSEYVYFWGCDMRYTGNGTIIPAYQRVTDTSTYDSSGFPYFLKFDGVDDNYTITSIDRTSWTDGTCFTANFASTGTGAVISNLDSSANANHEPYSDSNWYVSFGTSTRVNPGSLYYGSSYILTRNRSSGTSYYSINSVVSGTTATGTTSFNGTANIFIGKNDESAYYNGRVYGVILRGAATTSTQISNTESWLNGVAKIY